MDATRLLAEDHREIDRLLAKLANGLGGAEERTEILSAIQKELDVHTRIEEEIFYPAFRAVARTEEDRRMVAEAMEEHRAVNGQVLPDLAEVDTGTDEFVGRAKVLRELIEHHAGEEEGEMFPRARELLGEEKLADLGQRMQKMKQGMDGGRMAA